MGRWSFPALGLLLVLAGGCQSPKVDHVLLITIDTLRWDRLGYMGHDVATPNLDRLAHSGAFFTEAVTAAPITLPSHASIHTGLYPPSHRTRNNGSFRLPDDVETLAESFQEAGYATGAFIGAFVLDRRFGLEQGFDHYDDELPEENPLHSVYFAERPAEEVVGRALDWIKTHEDGPFFVWVHVYDPHAPRTAPSPYAERYPDRPYDAEIAYTDAALGPLIDAVSSIDAGRQTAIVVAGDHGESLGEHGESSHTLFVYDATMRIPLIMKGPGIPEGLKVEAQVRSVDIAPTILELAGLTPSQPMDGVSLLGSLRSGDFPPLAAYGETFATRFDFGWSELRFLRKDGFKFVSAPKPELYDLGADPRELDNLWSADDPPAVGRRLARELEKLKTGLEKGELVPNAELDEETRRRLESLGYAGSSLSSAAESKERADPKDRVAVFEKLQELLGANVSDEDAIRAYREILQMEPENAMARTRLANKFSELGRFEEAVAEYQELIRQSEIGSKGLENLAVALLLLERTEEALAVTARAVAEAPWYLEFQILRGEALEQAGRLDEAMEAYARAIELRPEDPENHWRHGIVALKSGDEARAERDFREALAEDDGFEPAKNALARVLAKTGRSKEAVALLGTVDASSTPDKKAALAEAYLASGRYDDARALLEQAREEDPENARVLALLGPVYGRAGELDRAAEALEKARALGETDPEMRRNLALVYLRRGKIGAAVTELRRLSEEVPEDPSVWFSLGNALLRTRDGKGAAASFERALALRPDWPEATFNLALAYERLGDREKARDAYRSYLAGPGGASDSKRRAEAERKLALLEHP